jgi:hypothetical protein
MRAEVVEHLVPRIMARLRPHHYDSLLIAGASVRPGTALERHAQRITQPAERKAVGMMLFKIFLEAVDGSGTFVLRILLDANSICAAQPILDAVLYRLFCPEPVTPRGMAELRALIFDWDGPLYLNGDGDLQSRLALAFAAL